MSTLSPHHLRSWYTRTDTRDYALHSQFIGTGGCVQTALKHRVQRINSNFQANLSWTVAPSHWGLIQRFVWPDALRGTSEGNC